VKEQLEMNRRPSEENCWQELLD